MHRLVAGNFGQHRALKRARLHEIAVQPGVFLFELCQRRSKRDGALLDALLEHSGDAFQLAHAKPVSRQRAAKKETGGGQIEGHRLVEMGALLDAK